jgi:hypothetical protein
MRKGETQGQREHFEGYYAFLHAFFWYPSPHPQPFNSHHHPLAILHYTLDSLVMMLRSCITQLEW